jgi:hypothetical protein
MLPIVPCICLAVAVGIFVATLGLGDDREA